MTDSALLDLDSRRLEYEDFIIRKTSYNLSATSIIIHHILIFLIFAPNLKN